MASPPETILQFGAGRFLRGFLDRFVQQANDQGQSVGQIVVVQSTPGVRANLLNAQPEGYHVLVRGYEDGRLVERVEPVRSVHRAMTAQGQWDEALTVARAPDLRLVVSNATEAGYTLDPADALDADPPPSQPAKLTRVLWERFRAGGPPLTLLPCELFERNADRLRALVLSLAKRWKLPTEFADWAERECLWLNNLVDCIITDPPADHPLAEVDRLLVCAEPFALLAVERPAGKQVPLFEHPAIRVVDDIAPFYLRKVRILNGAHTAMVGKFLGGSFETVQQVLADRDAARWVRDLIFEEIVPTLAYRLDGVAEFVDQTWDRFRNPFLEHRLSVIALHHADKMRIRLQPTREEYERLFGKPPPRLCEAMANEPQMNTDKHRSKTVKM